MRTTLFFKRADVVLQLTALIIPIIIGFFGEGWVLLVTYLTVGSAQLLSCLLNRLFLDKFLRHSNRTGYEIAIVFLIITFGLVFNLPGVPTGLRSTFFGLLPLISPFLAVWYGYISYQELRAAFMMVDRRQYL